MKKITLLISILTLLLSSCAAVRVETDYDQRANFSTIKTFAFYKEGVDAVKLSDLDKKRILRSIEEQMLQKGFTLSETPDVFINFFTQEEFLPTTIHTGFGWGWGPFYTGTTHVQHQKQGVLYIDIIDAQGKDLIWQGKGVGLLPSGEKKDERITTFVKTILSNYPPKGKNNN